MFNEELVEVKQKKTKLPEDQEASNEKESKDDRIFKRLFFKNYAQIRVTKMIYDFGSEVNKFV